MNTRTTLHTWTLRTLVFTSVLALLSCVPGGGHDGDSGGGGSQADCDHQGHMKHHHREWGDDKGRNHKEWDDDHGRHHEEWDDDHGRHHHVCCDDHGNHFHDWDDDHHHHHHDWDDDHGHHSHDWDDDEGRHHHDGDDDDDHDSDHTAYNTSTSTSTQTVCNVSTGTSTTTLTSTSTATYTFTNTDASCTIDVFHQAGGSQYLNKVDILFVMDHSEPMGRHWEEIAQNIESMVSQLPSSTDVRYAVMLADVGAWSGRLYSPFNAAYLSNQQLSTAQIAQALQKTFAAGMQVTDAASGETPIYSLYKGVTARAAENQKAGFFRPDAGLSVIFMSDGNDTGVSIPASPKVPVKCDASFEAGIKAKYYDANGINVASTLAALKALKGELPVKASAFVNKNTTDLFTDNSPNVRCIEDMIGYGFIDMAQATGGLEYSIHSDKAAGLIQLGQMINKSMQLQHDFQLSKPAAQVDPSTIQNAVDGALVSGVYNASNDSEHLDNAGTYGSTIQIKYCAPVSIPAWTLTNFTGVPSQTSVGLGWQTTQYATSGKVLWGTSANNLVNELDDTNVATAHSVTVNGLTPNTTYYFQAVASDSSGTTRSSNVIAITTLPQWTLANVSAQAARTNATILWTTAGYPTSGYVNWGTSANALTNQTSAAGVSASQSLELMGLSPATTYYYQVTASDTFNQTQSSAVQSFTTAADWGISGFTGAATRFTVTLDWQTPDQVTTGAILWGSSAALGNVAHEGAAAANSHEVVVSGLNADTDYYFQVQATDPSGNVKTSNVILVHTQADWSITGFAGTSTTTSVTVSWTTPGYATSGTVAYGSAANALSSSQADSVNGTSHSVTITGLNPNTTYYFQASGTDASGESKSSTVVAIATQQLPLPTWTITGPTGTSDTSSVTVSWQTTQYATSGVVLWGTSTSALSNQQADSVTGTSHSVTISGLASGTTYYFQVVASDNRGQTQNSDVIAVATTTTVVTPPTNWVIAGFDGTTTATQANLIWQTTGANTTATVAVGTSPTDLTLMSLQSTTPAQVTQLAVPGLSPSTTYYFQVTATDSSGRTVQSIVISKTTKAQ